MNWISIVFLAMACLIIGSTLGGYVLWRVFQSPTKLPTSPSHLQRLQFGEQIAGIGTWDWEPSSKTVWWSDEHYRLFGVDRSTFVPSYDTYIAMVHPDDVPLVKRAIDLVANGCNTYGHDYRIIRPDGKIIWLECRGKATRDAEGNLIRLTGIDQEITKRKQMEETLRDREDRFAAIFNQTFGFVGLMTIDGRLIEANQTSLEATGLKADDVIGKYFWDTPWWTHDQNLQQELKKGVAEARQGKIVRFEASHPQHNGQILWVDFSLKPYYGADGNLLWLIPEGRDITERKKTEEELRISRERYEAAIRGSRDGIWDWDVQNNVVFFSPRWKEMLGYKDDEIQNELASWQQLLHPEDQPEVFAVLNAYQLNQLQLYEIEFRMRTKANGYRWILSRGSATRDANGRCIRMAGSHTDVTERRQVANELAASERLLRKFIRHTPAAIAILDREFRYVQTSQRWISDYRLNHESVIGRSHLDVFPLKSDRWNEMYQRVLAGSVESCPEDLFHHADGTEEWLQWEARPWNTPDGEIGGIILFTQVITQRKRAEASVQISESLYRTVVASLAEGVVVQDSSGKIVANNLRAESILGLQHDELTGLTSTDTRWRSIYPNGEPYPGELHPAMRVLKTGQAYFNEVMGIHKPTGELTWIMINSVPIHERQSPKSPAVVTSFHDVTEARQMTERMQESLREKEVMLQEIHHRVKNNLAITVSLLNFQMWRLPEGTGRDAFKQAQNRLHSMALVHEMLYQSQSLSSLDLQQYVQQLLAHLKNGYADQHVEVIQEITPVNLNLERAIPFGLILNELVSNAFKYAFHNVGQPVLAVRLTVDSDRKCLSVKDNGCGFPATQKMEDTRTLGLRLVRELVIQIDGELEILQEQGTEFRIWFAC